MRGLPSSKAGNTGFADLGCALQCSSYGKQGSEDAATRVMPTVPRNATCPAAAFISHALSRRQGDLHKLPQSPWHSQSQPTDPKHHQRKLSGLPYGAPRTISLGTPTRNGKLCKLSRTPWNQQSTTFKSTHAPSL